MFVDRLLDCPSVMCLLSSVPLIRLCRWIHWLLTLPSALVQLSTELTSQANQLAAHQQQLTRLTTLLEELVKAMQQLLTSPPMVNPVAPNPPSSLQTSDTSMATVSPRLAFPDKFDGDPSQGETHCKGFLLQYKLFVNQQPLLSANHPVVLGLLWLRHHNPHIF